MGKEHLKKRGPSSSFDGTADEFKGVLLAIVAWREARGEGFDGMRAVMHVIRNRVAAGWGDWDTVISKRNQFSAMSVPSDSQLTVWPDDDVPKFMTLLGFANAIFYGEEADNTRGALYYYNPETARSLWYQRHVDSGEFVETTRIGHHTFHRERG